MKQVLFSLVLALCALGNPLQAEDTNGVVFSLKSDDKMWKMGSEFHTDSQQITQYIPETQTINNWKELFTIQTMENARLDPMNVFQLLLKELSNIGSGEDIVGHRILSNDDKGLLAEWWIDHQSPNDQHEWIRIFNAGSSTAILRYTTRNTDKLDKAAKIWIPILTQAYYKPLMRFENFYRDVYY
ncbi:hypothetical protein PHSC3_001472 [Chlamydiales bacterium STE3]|nr:hypothetical protein PHSC3_001472 [Chlamydiales bacterium STE3]